MSVAISSRNADGEELGAEALSESLREFHSLTADAVATAVTETVLVHAGDIEALDDDVTVVVVSRDGVNATEDYEATFRSRSSLAPSQPSSTAATCALTRSRSSRARIAIHTRCSPGSSESA